MQRQAEQFNRNGICAHYNVEPDQAYSLDSLAGANEGRLFDLLARRQYREHCDQRGQPETASDRCQQLMEHGRPLVIFYQETSGTVG
jgi:hypothetical protein